MNVAVVPFRCVEAVQVFLDDKNPEATLNVGTDMRKIHECFRLLKASFIFIIFNVLFNRNDVYYLFKNEYGHTLEKAALCLSIGTQLCFHIKLWTLLFQIMNYVFNLYQIIVFSFPNSLMF